MSIHSVCVGHLHSTPDSLSRNDSATSAAERFEGEGLSGDKPGVTDEDSSCGHCGRFIMDMGEWIETVLKSGSLPQAAVGTEDRQNPPYLTFGDENGGPYGNV